LRFRSTLRLAQPYAVTAAAGSRAWLLLLLLL